MASAIKFIKTIRTHWKKSTLGLITITYAAMYTKEYIETQKLMREYCARAAVYGNAPIPVDVNPKTITVILNPNANRRKATQQFEKYCAPILHLAGMCVDVLHTESEGHAKTLIENLSNTDAIIVAGGDGTLSEVVTGLLRRTNENPSNLLPIGVLPLGRSNTLAKRFFPGGNHLENVRSLADASMAIIEETTKPVDVLKIEVIEEEEQEEEAQVKPIYALSGLQWGAYRDAHCKRDNYWYFGPLRNYATYLFNGYKKNLCWRCEAIINYSVPCAGCSNCCANINSNRRWYHRILPFGVQSNSKDYSNVINTECGQKHEKKIRTSDLVLLSGNVKERYGGPAKLELNLGPKRIGYFDFVRKGWQSEKGLCRPSKETIEARTIEIHPIKLSKKKENWFSIDNEDYEVKPVKITLLPKLINMFCKNDKSVA